MRKKEGVREKDKPRKRSVSEILNIKNLESMSCAGAKRRLTEMRHFIDAERNLWHRQMMRVAEIAYEAGKKRDRTESQALYSEIMAGAYDPEEVRQ